MPDRPILIVGLNLSGGIGNDIVNWAHLFRDAGHPCSVALWKNEGHFAGRLPEGVRVLTLGKSGFLAASRRLARILRDNPSATVLVSQYKAGASAVLARWLARTDNRIVYREPSMPRRYLNAYTLFRYYRLGLSRVDAALAQTPTAAAELSSLGIPADRISLLPNLPPRRSRDEAAPPPPEAFAGDSPKLITVGRLTREKGAERLIRAMPGLLRRFPGATLTIVGDGNLRPELEALSTSLGLSDKIRFTGSVADPAPLLREADLFVTPSFYEGLSNALLEALFAGRRVVSTRAGGGMADFMRDLGAADCVIEDSDFERELVRVVAHALAKTRAEWEPVFNKLHENYGYDAVSQRLLAAVNPHHSR